MIGQEAQPNADVALAPNQRLHSISLQLRHNSGAQVLTVLQVVLGGGAGVGTFFLRAHAMLSICLGKCVGL